jgi:catechol O-methyltransferase
MLSLFWTLLLTHALSTNSESSLLPESLITRSRTAALRCMVASAPWLIGSCAHALTARPNLGRDALYRAYPYQVPSDILAYLKDYSEEGDAVSVLRALDEFSDSYPMYKLTPEKATVLVGVVNTYKPTCILEIGSFFGYSAVNIARNMPVNCSLLCIEGNKDNAEIATYVLRRAFSRTPSILERVKITVGLSSSVLRATNRRELLTGGKSLASTDFKSGRDVFDMVFLDHDKDSYLPDLKYLESEMLLGKRCAVVADNIVFPGAPGFLGYVGATLEGGTGDINDETMKPKYSVQSDSGWDTQVQFMPFERVGFETGFKPRMDGMSISIRNIKKLSEGPKQNSRESSL